MAEVSPPSKKVHPENEDLEKMTKGELVSRIKEQEQYIKQLESKKPKLDKGDDDPDVADKLKQQQKEAARRENTLVHRLATKEQELQDYVSQIGELKQAQTQGTAQLKSMLLDPAVNIVFQRMSKELEEAQEKLKQTQNELSAWKFTPDSQTGKRLMARCQMLLQENEELGKTISSGRTAKLEGEIALQKTLVTEMKNNQSELDEFLGDLEEDVEGMQTMIYVLQQQLRDAKDNITALEDENTRLRSGDTSIPVKTLPKKPDKTETPEPTTETTNQTTYTETKTSGLKAMDTAGYYEEKTESDLEAEYNYEGLYENEDKYQEEGQQEAGSYDYEENGYTNYAEEYAIQDYKSEDETGHEPMETDDTPTTDDSAKRTHNVANNGTKDDRASPAANSVLTDVTPVSKSSAKDQTNSTSQQCNASVSHSDVEQHVTTSDSTSGQHRLSDPTASSAPDSTHQSGQELDSKLDHHSTNVPDHSTKTSPPSRQSPVSNVQPNSDSSLRIPSPKPSNNSPVTNVATAAATTNEKTDESSPANVNSLSPTTNGSPNHSTKPLRTSSTSPTNQVTTASEEKTSPGSKLSSNDKSPGQQKDREPVLQKFLNGVTSTVDDIEDL